MNAEAMAKSQQPTRATAALLAFARACSTLTPPPANTIPVRKHSPPNTEANATA